jgi:hypothetical protein
MAWSLTRRLLLGGTALVLLGGCLSPTLPMPPPLSPEITPPDASGIATVTGRVPAGTTAYVHNIALGLVIGKRTGSTGKYQIQILAREDDQLEIYYMEGLERSQAVVLLVPGPDVGQGGAGGAP